MEKDPLLINIYLKIHNKRTLTLDDLRYLAKYAPECFEKTCKNVVYNIPETKPIMEPAEVKASEPQNAESKNVENQKTGISNMGTTNTAIQNTATQNAGAHNMEPEVSERQKIEQVLENLKRLEANEVSVENVNADEVKSLLGNLYMEMLFPHNDKDTFMKMPNNESAFFFDKKA